MRILVTADLHFDIARSRQPTLDLAARVVATPADALLIVGDIAGPDLTILDECLRHFEPFGGLKMLVAGNHDLWADPPQADSLVRYEEHLRAAAAKRGFHYLDHEPCYLNDLAFVGSVGWYDYSYARADLHVPRRFYEAKLAPGAAARLSRYRHLVDGHDDVPPDMLQVGTRWMDGLKVHLPFGDPEFCERLADKFRRHLADAAARTQRIVAAVHHLPFEDMVIQKGNNAWDFANAFMGSPLFGEALLAEPKVAVVYTGHSHARSRVSRGHLTCINVGSTYTTKRLEVLEL